jgi:hypothetical protein
MAKSFDDGAEPTWGLYVDEQRRDMDSRKSIKVKLPIRQHIKLHALKLFSENNISQTVEAALDMYFERMRAQELAARAAVGSAEGAAGGAADGGGSGSGEAPGAGTSGGDAGAGLPVHGGASGPRGG